MSPSAELERLLALTSGLGPEEWRWLGAIALEHALERSVLGKLSGRAVDPWVHDAIASGLLVHAATGTGIAPSPGREPTYSVHPRYEQLVLRRLAETHDLEDIALETQALLGARSVADLNLAIQAGDGKQLERRWALRRVQPKAVVGTIAEWLRIATCEPFDADWLRRTWGGDAMRVATRVLESSLDGPHACTDLRAFCARELRARHDDAERLSLASILCQHATLRGDLAAIGELAALLPHEHRLGFAAAAELAGGNLSGAQERLTLALSGAPTKTRSERKRGTLPRCGAVQPMLALLLCARDTPEDLAIAKRLLAAGTSDTEHDVARAFRTLLRYLGEPDVHHRRIDVHQLPAGSGAWEILLSAITVHLHLTQTTTRASWATHLVRKAVSWQRAGYLWLARQAFALSKELSAEYATSELGRHEMDPSTLQCSSREVRLFELLAPKPEWKKTLDALAEVSESVGDDDPLTYRAAWFVDMTDGSLSRPALQEYRLAAGGWSGGKRLSVAELHEHRQHLPPEDLRVLDCTREIGGRRDFTPEAYEALIGHPRVLNGARGPAPVEVVRGSCRIEAEEDAGYIRLVVEPEGAVLGVNVVPETESRLVVYRVTRAMRRVIDVLPRGVRIPKAQEQDVLRVLGKLSQSVEVKSRELFVERAVEPDATPCLRFAPQAGAWLVQIGVRPFGTKGRFFLAGTGSSGATMHVDGQRLRCERSLEQERARVTALIAECPTLAKDPDEQEDARGPHDEGAWVFGEESVLALLSELRDATTLHALEWPESGSLRLRGHVTSKSLKARLRARKGWYIATGGVALDDLTDVALSELVRAPVLAGGRFLRLPNGDYVEVEKRIRAVLTALAAMSSGKRGSAELAIHPGALPALEQLAATDSGVDVDEATRSWLSRARGLAAKEFPVPGSLRATLRPYQVDGYLWLCRLSELGLGACLSDDMGLGKTLQILALLVARAGEGPALVVAPTSVCSNWALEMQRFAPALTPVEYAGKDRAAALAKVTDAGAPGTVVITSYALLQQDDAALGAIEWGTAVLDEAQFIKNSESLRARAAFRLSAKQRVAATGTPVENHYGDLWSIFRFLNPGLLGDLRDFNLRFVRPIERDGSAAPEATLRRIVQPYVLRRLKSDVLAELPPLTQVSHEVHLSQDEAVRYAVLRKQIHTKLYTAHGKRHNKIEVLAEITRLRRFCCHPRLVFPDAPAESSKIQTFLELVDELVENRHRALVFSQYVDFLSLVREALDERRISYEYLDGSTPQAQRQRRVDAFQNGAASLFLISLKAGGFGLNLTAADYVIHLDPWWNPAVESQATDRAHRIGQERRVTVYRLVTKDTIEEKIVALHDRKQRLARSLLEDGDEAASLSAEELVELISGVADARELGTSP